MNEKLRQLLDIGNKMQYFYFKVNLLLMEIQKNLKYVLCPFKG